MGLEQEIVKLNLSGKVERAMLKMLESIAAEQAKQMLGEIKMFAGATLPEGWAVCDGAALSVETYPELFAVIGNTYGGDGVTNFELPDLRGRAAVGAGQGDGLTNLPLAGIGGNETVTVEQNNLPALDLPITASIAGDVTVGTNEEDPNQTEAATHYLGNTNTPIIYNNVSAPTGALGGVTHNLTVSGTAATGGGDQPINNRNPYVALNYIIYIGE